MDCCVVAAAAAAAAVVLKLYAIQQVKNPRGIGALFIIIKYYSKEISMVNSLQQFSAKRINTLLYEQLRGHAVA
jgi:hypothetical protein